MVVLKIRRSIIAAPSNISACRKDECMVEIPVKKYRVKKAFKRLRKLLLPDWFDVQKVVRKWSRKDSHAWPPTNRTDGSGLQHYEYSWLSQNGEDGIIRHLFDEARFESRIFVEFGFGAQQCNALRLMVHEKFTGLMMDGSSEQCDRFNRAAAKLKISNVRAVCTFIDLENLETLISDNGIPRNIDFLSIDVNGNDYWFWEKLQVVSPRVACIEYNAGMGPSWSCTVPYSADFERYDAHPSGFFAGASLKALETLGRRKGYRLVGCDATGTNSFFLRDDIHAPNVLTLTAEEAFKPHANWIGRGISEAEQLEIMRSMPYVDV